MSHQPNPATASERSRQRRHLRFIAALTVAVSLLASCGAATASVAGDDAQYAAEAQTVVFEDDVELFDSSVVHAISVTFDADAYDEIISAYVSTGDKDWMEVTVTVDGTTFESVGMRLKGNSSLFSLTEATSGSPEDLPWLIRFDKYIDGQTYQGYTDLVIRSNSTETALNEAVALELLDLSGLAAQEAMATSFTMNGGETELRLAVELPDEDWDDANFDTSDAALYKADSEGDYSYRGDDTDAYVDVFDQKAGEDDLEPLIAFLDFINNSDDETFFANIGDYLDVDAFSTYLAFQDLVGNQDDIDGRGNNSYLHYDYETGQMTVVNWDLNLAFETANVTGGPGLDVPGDRPAPPGGAAPVAGGPETATGGVAPGAGGPGAGGSNILVERLMADTDFADLYAAKTAELSEVFYGSGAVDSIIAEWVEVLAQGASDLVDMDTINAEAAAITNYIDATK